MDIIDIMIAKSLSGGGGGSSVSVEPLTITSNGTYTADKGTAYSPVTVNVPSGGGGSAGASAVNFYDYEGTLLYSYSLSEISELTSLPSNPSHVGLTAQGWNWNLEDIKSYLASYPDGVVNVGQMYITDDGKTRLYIHIDDDTTANRMTFYVRFASSISDNTLIDWGDGTSEVKGSTTPTDYPHTYTTTGDFLITLTVNDGTISFVGSGTSTNQGYSIYGTRAAENAYNRGRIRKVEIGNNLVEIGFGAFFQCSSLASITIPNNVTSIGDYAFTRCYCLGSLILPTGVMNISLRMAGYCYCLKAVAIPSGVTDIDDDAFTNCRNITSITIPSGVTSIGFSAFGYCDSITSITVPSGVTNLGGSAFRECNSISSITIPDGITSLDDNLFRGCYNLSSITIPNNVTSIGAYVFFSCHRLTSITIPNAVTSIGEYCLQNCYGLTSITIPSNITKIGQWEFADCYGLTSITIPSNVTTINSNAFYNCYGVSEYHMLSATPPTLSATNAFTNMASDCIIYVPAGSLEAYQTATNWSTYASHIQEESV